MPARNNTLTDARRRQLAELAERLGHQFGDLGLLDRALCHASTGNEGRESYERLEFLGDAILGFLVADHVFGLTPEIPEGELTDRRAQIVSRKPLSGIAGTLGLDRYLVVGRGLREEDRQSNRIRADLVEAVLAAIYLDGGVRAARRFVQRHVLPGLPEPAAAGSERDSKSRLLHYAQVNIMGQPSYELQQAWGPDHERWFEVAVVLQGEQIAVGRGRTKQDAEKQAAAEAISQFRQQNELAPGPDEDNAP